MAYCKDLLQMPSEGSNRVNMQLPQWVQQKTWSKWRKQLETVPSEFSNLASNVCRTLFRLYCDVLDWASDMTLFFSVPKLPFFFFNPASDTDSGDWPWCGLPHWSGFKWSLWICNPDSLQTHTLRRPNVGSLTCRPLLYFIWQHRERSLEGLLSNLTSWLKYCWVVTHTRLLLKLILKLRLLVGLIHDEETSQPRTADTIWAYMGLASSLSNLLQCRGTQDKGTLRTVTLSFSSFCALATWKPSESS